LGRQQYIEIEIGICYFYTQKGQVPLEVLSAIADKSYVIILQGNTPSPPIIFRLLGR